ncbi:MAG TPA: hypothetical protein VHY08_20840 [Bacillota bacterium]|nr:hypothetical protein [Bacillota bacterium]
MEKYSAIDSNIASRMMDSGESSRGWATASSRTPLRISLRR